MSRISVRRCGQRRPPIGFTLVELLVVVSIIALLISILLPSLKKAREQAKVTVCLANLKGIATASLVYASDDSTEAAVPIHASMADPSLDAPQRRLVGAHTWGGKSGRGVEVGDKFFWGTGKGRGPSHRPLNKFIYKDGFSDFRMDPGPGLANWKNDEKLDLGLFNCPSDTGYKGIHWQSWRESGLSSYDHYGNSYAANLLWIFSSGGGDPDCGGQPCCRSNAPVMRPLSRIPNPSNTLYYEENVGRYAFWAEPNDSSCGETLPGTVGGWHGRDWVFNVAFVDAHAATIKMKGAENPRLSDYPYGDYMHWHCVIVRGAGYQRDTLPSPPVWTQIPCSTAAGDVD